MMTALHKFPALHNAMWPGLVGKGPDSEPPISLENMLALTAAAEVDGNRFEGVDLFLSLPHTDIDSSDDDLARLAERLRNLNLLAGSLVAPVWEPTGGGSAMGTAAERDAFLTQVRKACRIGAKLRDLGIRQYGVIRIDSAAPPSAWAENPAENTRRIAQTFQEAGKIAQDHGEVLAAEGEICWAGMHSWRRMRELLEAVNMPGVVGFQADMAHTMLFTMGHNAPEDSLLPPNYTPQQLRDAYAQVAHALRPWTVDFHIAQNDGTVNGTGSHDKTGRHCLPLDPAGRLDIVHDAGAWMRDDNGQPTRTFRHICWDGCMFPNDVMMKPETWNDVLRVMVQVRNAHGWN